MELRQLEYFVAVCQELHFSRAAEKLGISQPNLSLRIKALEDEIGMKLFDRIGKRIMLTPAGEVLYRHSQGLFSHVKNAYDELAELRDAKGGKLSVGIVPSYLDDRLTSLFVDFHNEFPNVNLTIVSTTEIAKLVLDTTIDVGIGLISVPDERLAVIPLYREEYGLVVSEQHALAQRQAVSIDELKDLPVVLYPRGYWGRDLIDTVCRKHGFELHTVIETTSNQSLFRFVSENIGVTVHTPYFVNRINIPQLRFIPISDEPPYRDMGVVYLSDRYLTHAARTFISQVQEFLTKLVITL